MFGGTHVGPPSLDLERLSKMPAKGHRPNGTEGGKEEERVQEVFRKQECLHY